MLEKSLRFQSDQSQKLFSCFLGMSDLLPHACLQNLVPALVSLGLNIMEQEVIDLINTIARNGLVFFPDFSSLVLRKLREDDEEQFAQVMFKVREETSTYYHLTLAGVVWDKPSTRAIQGQEI